MLESEICETILVREAGPDLHYPALETPNTRARVVVLHGFGEYSVRYQHVLRALEGRRFSSFATHYRGWGKTEGLVGHVISFEDYIHDVDAIIFETVKSLLLSKDRERNRCNVQ